MQRQQIEKSEKLNAEGQYSDALEVLRNMDMSFPKVIVELGKAEAGLGNFDRAAEHFEKASVAYAKLAKLKVDKPAPAAPAAPPPTEKPNVQEKPKFDWYQSPDQVFVSFPYKNLDPSDVHVDFQSNSLTIQVKSTLYCTLQLHADIAPSQSSFKVTRFKIEVILGKQTKGTTWPALEQAAAVKPQEQLPSAYSSKKKWDGKALGGEEEEEAPDDDPMNTLLRKIYKDANEETRMAMKKSMQTSGGTVLTTNWNEAKDKDFSKEIKPPAGQVFKDWNGKVIAKSDS